MAHRDRGAGRERERERDRYDDRRREGREPPRGEERSTAPSTSTKRGPLNEFFVNGEGINREVLQRELCKYLGADALCRPGNYNGETGYIVTAVRPFTSKMIEDIQRLSQDYEREKRERRNRDLSYAASATRERQEAMDPYEQEARYIPQGRYPEREMYPEKYPEKYTGKHPERYPDTMYPPGYAGPGGYPAGTTYPQSQAPGYPAVSGYPSAAGYPASSAYPQGPNYPPVSGYPPSSGYVAPGYTPTSGMPGSRAESNYIYADQTSEYPPGYLYQQSGAYPGGLQANSRTGAGYPFVSSAPEGVLRPGTTMDDRSYGTTVDDRSYDMYSQQMMSGQTGRAGYQAPSRGTPTLYDPPQPMEGYSRGEIPRDDRPRRR